jgi:hypothetical protein
MFVWWDCLGIKVVWERIVKGKITILVLKILKCSCFTLLTHWSTHTKWSEQFWTSQMKILRVQMYTSIQAWN